MGSAATKAERAHMELVKSLPCVACHEGWYDALIMRKEIVTHWCEHSEYDHMVDGYRLGHMFGLPLHPNCHIGKKGHSGGRRWDSSKPNQWRLLEKVYKVIGKEIPPYNPKGRNNFQP